MTPGEWIEWAGGECPVADGAEVEIRWFDADMGDWVQTSGPADTFSWPIIGKPGAPDDGDIIAYRVVQS